MAGAGIPLLGVGLALILWGSYVVPMKMSSSVREAQLATVWFQAYIGVGVLASSVFFMAVPGEDGGSRVDEGLGVGGGGISGRWI